MPPPPVRTPESLPGSAYHIDPRPNYDFDAIALLIHDLINRERKNRRLGELTYNPALSRITLEHSKDKAQDNVWSTGIDKPCSEIFIRHEGSSLANFSLGDRLKNAGISFREGRENIFGMAVSKNLIYRITADQDDIICPDFQQIPMPGHPTFEEAQNIIQSNIASSKTAFGALAPMTFVNREWLESYEVANRAVTGWINSPGHKENLLAPAITQDGIGIVWVNEYLIITHDFINP